MALYIAIDGGTTNTRISLLNGTEIMDRRRYNIGVKSNIRDKTVYKNIVKEAINSLLVAHGLDERDIVCLLASGMITSEFGFVELEHITVPAGIEKLHNTAKRMILSDISDIPFVFIRGVKNPTDDLENADMMRGEESELIGIREEHDGECTYVLPGSHSKIIQTDANGNIVAFSTMLTGEMIAALSQYTILKDAVDLEKAAFDKEYLLIGFDFCRRNGLNKSLFKVRILKNLFGQSADRCYSFFLGAVLCDEIAEITKNQPKKIVVGGQKQLKTATVEILRSRFEFEIVDLPPEKTADANAVGMVKIYEYRP